jgi:uncharacterized protein YjbI with pentapeptide repeats
MMFTHNKLEILMIKLVLAFTACIFGLSVSATDLGFRYKNGACVNSNNATGLNPGFIGQCGDLRQTTISGFSFDGLDLSGTAFVDATLLGCTFQGTILTGANLTGIDLTGVVLNQAMLNLANFDHAVLVKAQFVGADFSGSKLDKADFTNADLSSAILNGATGTAVKLKYASLKQADLTAAVLMGADFRHAALDQAKLNNTNLEQADLRAAQLTNVNLATADLKGATFSKKTTLPISQDQALQMGMTLGNDAAVYILWDTSATDPDILSLKAYLEKQDIDVTLAPQPAFAFSGTENLSNYTGILHLLGSEGDNTSYHQNLPVVAQTALVNFVKNGGTYIPTEWIGFMVESENYLTQMRDLVLIKRVAYEPAATWSPVSTQSDHPVLQGITNSFVMTGTYSTGNVYVFPTNPAVPLVTDANGYTTVAVRNFGQGKVVHFASAPTDVSGTLQNASLQLLIANAINWGN